MTTAKPEYVLHTYFRSSCSARVRIALNLKGIDYDAIYVNLLKDAHKADENVAINPLGFVPTLEVREGNNDVGIILTQSLAILEYLEEKHDAGIPLLPPKTDPVGRGHVRALANVIACDVQPVTNMRILRKIKAIGGSDRDWAQGLMNDGLAAYEKLATSNAGRFSYGDAISMADVCLVPAVWGALRFGVDMQQFPVVKRVFEEMSKEEAVKKAHWQNQPDCPEDLR